MGFKHKEVVNIKDGRRLEYVQGVTADLETEGITYIIGSGRFIFERNMRRKGYVTNILR